MLLLSPWVAKAQVDDAVELWVEERGESGAADLHDLLLQLADNPVNLNDTDAVSAVPFVSPFQLRSLKNYILLHIQNIFLRNYQVHSHCSNIYIG